MIAPTSRLSFASRRRSRPARPPVSRLAGLLLAGLLLALALPAAPVWAAPARPLRVVTTFSILDDMVKAVGGPYLSVTTLVGPDGDVHTYEPSPADARALVRADVVVSSGLGLETGFDRLYDASGSKATRFVASQGVHVRYVDKAGTREADPHCWQDVRDAMVMVRNIRDGLCAADPSAAANIKDRAAHYLKELQQTDAYIAKRAAEIPSPERKLVTSHDALGYFARRYDFQVIGQALSSLSTEAAEPSAREMADIIEEIRRAHVPAVFTENIHSPKLMDQIARDAHVKIVTSLYTDALGAPGTPGATYIGMMRYNIDTIAKALHP